MNRTQALHAFWSGFGIPAIDELSSYDRDTMQQLGIDYPYIAYEAAVGGFDAPLALTASLYYRSASWALIEEKAAEIATEIGEVTWQRFDGGAIRIWMGEPRYRRMSADNAFDVRRIQININAEFIAA